MGAWKWLNLAVVGAACWYCYLDVFVLDWNPYEPVFQTIATATFARCTTELQTGVHRGRTWLQIRLEPTSCWTETKRAWLVVGTNYRVLLSGGRHRFRTKVEPDTPNPSATPVTLEIESWDSARKIATLQPTTETRHP